MVKKIFSVLIFLFLGVNITFGSGGSMEASIVKCNRCTCPESSLKGYKDYIDRLQVERAIIYNALNLSDEQIQIYEQMMSESVPCFEQDYNKLVKECHKLNAMQTAKAGECDILRQKRVVQKLKNSLEKSFDKSTKPFRKCLTMQQRAKYGMIKKLAHDDVKKASHKKDYYKANPQMRPFGNEICH